MGRRHILAASYLLLGFQGSLGRTIPQDTTATITGTISQGDPAATTTQFDSFSEDIPTETDAASTDGDFDTILPSDGSDAIPTESDDDVPQITGTPTCNKCQVIYHPTTIGWADYIGTIQANATEAWESSVSASLSGNDFIISYATAIPTREYPVNASYTLTATCCDTYTVEAVEINYSYETAALATNFVGRLFTSTFDVTCAPTSTYFIPDKTVLFSGTDYDDRNMVPSNTCSTPRFEAGPVPPKTKTIVAQLVKPSTPSKSQEDGAATLGPIQPPVVPGSRGNTAAPAVTIPDGQISQPMKTAVPETGDPGNSNSGSSSGNGNGSSSGAGAVSPGRAHGAPSNPGGPNSPGSGTTGQSGTGSSGSSIPGSGTHNGNSNGNTLPDISNPGSGTVNGPGTGSSGTNPPASGPGNGNSIGNLPPGTSNPGTGNQNPGNPGSGDSSAGTSGSSNPGSGPANGQSDGSSRNPPSSSSSGDSGSGSNSESGNSNGEPSNAGSGASGASGTDVASNDGASPTGASVPSGDSAGTANPTAGNTDGGSIVSDGNSRKPTGTGSSGSNGQKGTAPSSSTATGYVSNGGSRLTPVGTALIGFISALLFFL